MKKISLVLFLISFFTISAFSQDFESEEYDELDDFDSIFAEAEDIEAPVIEEEKKNETPVQIVASAFSSMVHFSGNFTGEVGAVFIHDKTAAKENNVSGYFSLNNTLNMNIKPSDVFVIHGSLKTGVDTSFNISVDSLYFDYLLFNRIYITAGKKSISWGNLRLFNNSDYFSANVYSKPADYGKYQGYLFCTGPLYAGNIFSEDGAPYSLQIRYPWSFGTLTFATTLSDVKKLEIDSFNFYGSIEVSVLNTNINLYAKRPEKNSGKDSNGNPDPNKTWKNNIFGLELKRTILGFDTYGQMLVRVKDYKNLTHSTGYDYITGTIGLYRLWDSFDPNIGFNIEYQHEFNPALSPRNIDRIAFEGGLKRIGPKKNMKIGILSHLNITEKYGYTGLSFIISGICPYADWTNKFAVGYGAKYTQGPVVLFSSAISLSLDY